MKHREVTVYKVTHYTNHKHTHLVIPRMEIQKHFEAKRVMKKRGVRLQMSLLFLFLFLIAITFFEVAKLFSK